MILPHTPLSHMAQSALASLLPHGTKCMLTPSIAALTSPYVTFSGNTEVNLPNLS